MSAAGRLAVPPNHVYFQNLRNSENYSIEHNVRIDEDLDLEESEVIET